MENVNKLLEDREYQQQIKQLEELEKERVYCGHGVEHLLAVARIAQLENLESGWNMKKESIYLAALLHDLGRIEEYLQGIPHDKAGEKKAEYFLNKLNLTTEEKQEIAGAVSGHRNKGKRQEQSLAELIKRADKSSRNCRFCKAYDTCKWSEKAKNQKLWH